MPLCIVCSAKHYMDLGEMPEAMVTEVAAEFQLKPEQTINAVREMLLTSTYDEIEPIFQKLAAIAARHNYAGIRLIPTS